MRAVFTNTADNALWAELSLDCVFDSCRYKDILLWLKRTFDLKIDRHKAVMAIQSHLSSTITRVHLSRSVDFTEPVDLFIWEPNEMTPEAARSSYNAACTKYRFSVYPYDEPYTPQPTPAWCTVM